jgi:hypothetical protein
MLIAPSSIAPSVVALFSPELALVVLSELPKDESVFGWF